MNFSDHIKTAETKTGGPTALAKALELHATHLSNIKAGTRPMPDEATVKLGQIVGLENPLDMLAIRNESRAKTEEERQFWSPFAKHASTAKHAMNIAMMAAVTGLCVTTSIDAKATPQNVYDAVFIM